MPCSIAILNYKGIIEYVDFHLYHEPKKMWLPLGHDDFHQALSDFLFLEIGLDKDKVIECWKRNRWPTLT